MLYEVLYTVLTGYILGSILTAIILSKILKFPDPRKHGSKNPGTSNVVRTAGIENGIYVLIGDIAKGAITVLVVKYLIATGNHAGMMGIGCIAAVIGHLFPVWFKFKGGKGVATFIGCLLAINVWSGLLAIALWAIIMLIFRIASIASLIAVIAGLVLFITQVISGTSTLSGAIFPMVVAAAIVIWAHRDNIKNLRAGNEKKV
jgi:acyl phosphate:glycerol-3-phosphate acyltransferase